MKTYDLSVGKFVILSEEELEHYNIGNSTMYYSKVSDIRYESFDDYNHLNYVFYTFKNKTFEYTPINLIIKEGHLIYVLDEEDPLNQEFINSFIETHSFSNNIEALFYAFMDYSLKNMFKALFDYETYISEVEDVILMSKHDVNLDNVVALKNESLTVKKYNSQLLYVSDALLVNTAYLSLEDKYLHNIDSRVNKLFEYSNTIYESSAHLMELYNSKITSNTNDVINKLTIFTVFATPLTVITGIYGMNFSNMPELSHPYGYYIAILVMLVIDLVIYFVLKKIKLL